MNEDRPIDDAMPATFRFGRYLFWVGLLGCVLFVLPYFLIREPHYTQWTSSAYGRDLEYGMTAAHVDADVVIYGDSTALYGIDPRRVAAQLGVSVFNIPNLLPSLRGTGDLGLKRYLAANKRPRLIVLYLSPWDLDFGNFAASDPAYDGEEMLLRHGSIADVAAFAHKNPTPFLQFPFVFYRVNALDSMQTHRDPPRVIQSLGHEELPPYAPLAADCRLPAARAVSSLPMQTALELRARYNTPTIPAIVYIAPIPACSNAAVVLRNDFSALHAAAPRLLAPGDIVQDGYYAHPLATHVDEVSDQLADALRPLLTQRETR